MKGTTTDQLLGLVGTIGLVIVTILLVWGAVVAVQRLLGFGFDQGGLSWQVCKDASPARYALMECEKDFGPYGSLR